MCSLPSDKLVVNINTIKPEQAALLVGLYQGKIGLDDARRVLTTALRRGGRNKQEMTEQCRFSRVPSPGWMLPGHQEQLLRGPSAGGGG